MPFIFSLNGSNHFITYVHNPYYYGLELHIKTTIKVEVRKVTAGNKQSYFRTCYAHDCRRQRRTHWLEVQVGRGNSLPPGCSVGRQRCLSVWAHSNSQTTEKRTRASLKGTKPFNDFPFPKCKNQSFHGLEGHT